MQQVNTKHHRVGVFSSIEVHVEAQPGEWVRNDSRSTPPLADIVNTFLRKNNAQPISVSAPTTALVNSSVSSDGVRTKIYKSSLSLIYSPSEEVVNGPSSQEQTDTTGITFDGVPEEYKQTIIDAIRRQSAGRSEPETSKASREIDEDLRSYSRPKHRRDPRSDIRGPYRN